MVPDAFWRTQYGVWRALAHATWSLTYSDTYIVVPGASGAQGTDVVDRAPRALVAPQAETTCHDTPIHSQSGNAKLLMRPVPSSNSTA